MIPRHRVYWYCRELGMSGGDQRYAPVLHSADRRHPTHCHRPLDGPPWSGSSDG